MTPVLAIGPYAEAEIALLTEAFDPQFLAGPEEMAGLDAPVREAIAAVAYKGHHPFGADEMAQLPNLGMVANFGVGYDAIDTNAASERGVRVTNTPDVLNDDVADLAVALLLAQCREIEQAGAWARSGGWKAHGEWRLNRKVSGGAAGIVGLGRIGREIAKRLAAFKMDIHYFARSEKETPGWTHHGDPVSLARAVDFLIVSIVGGEQTRGFVSRDAIEALGPRGVLVNVSRGTTVDEEALIEALEGGRIAGAALDVFLNEPDIDPRLLALESVVVQPHQGSGTMETRLAMCRLQRDNIAAHLAGEPLPTPVN